MSTIETFMPTIEAMCQGKGNGLVEMAKNFTMQGLSEHIEPRNNKEGFSEIVAVAAEACGLTEEEARFAGYQDSLPWTDEMIIEFTVAYFEA